MATMTPPSPPLLLLLLLLAAPPTSAAFSVMQLRTLFSLAHSLTIRVANLRASRGDIAGAERATLMAHKLERGMGLGFWGAMWSMGWDFARNYAWRDAVSFELFGAAADMNELLSLLNELSQVESVQERALWAGRNYTRVFRVSNSLLQKLLKAFHRSGTLRQAVEVVQKEVVEGELLKDCLELGSDGLKGFIQVLKDVASQFSSSYASDRSDL